MSPVAFRRAPRAPFWRVHGSAWFPPAARVPPSLSHMPRRARGTARDRYVRDDPAAHEFLSTWIDARCGFHDQYALAHAMLALAGRRGCVRYAGELFANFTYKELFNKRLAATAAARGGAFAHLFRACGDLDRACAADFCDPGDAVLLPGLRHLSVDVAATRRFKYARAGRKRAAALVVNDHLANKSDRVFLRDLGLDGVDMARVLFPPRA